MSMAKCTPYTLLQHHLASNPELEIKMPYCFNAILRIVFGINSTPRI